MPPHSERKIVHNHFVKRGHKCLLQVQGHMIKSLWTMLLTFHNQIRGRLMNKKRILWEMKRYMTWVILLCGREQKGLWLRVRQRWVQIPTPPASQLNDSRLCGVSLNLSHHIYLWSEASLRNAETHPRHAEESLVVSDLVKVNWCSYSLRSQVKLFLGEWDR